MRPRYELQKDHRVNRHVSTSRSADNGPEDAESVEVAQARHSSPKDTTNNECSVESGFSSDQIRCCAPKEGTKD